jgi:hypothetical protein
MGEHTSTELLACADVAPLDLAALVFLPQCSLSSCAHPELQKAPTHEFCCHIKSGSKLTLFFMAYLGWIYLVTLASLGILNLLRV